MKSEIAFDAHCPSLKNIIQQRTCGKCGIYFASGTLLKNHREIHQNDKSLSKLKPKKILRRRKQEVLIISEDNADDPEWVEKNDVCPDSLKLFKDEEDNNSEMPTITIHDHLQNVWEEIK